MPPFFPDDFKEGQILLIDKPLKWTSFQVVNKLRWMIRKSCDIKKIKVGHAGTLDPLATGLLLIATGKFTKRITELMGQEKEYTGMMTLGSTTPSYDLETEIDEHFETAHISEEKIHDATRQFIGEILQQPPIFSAIKKDGVRLYEHARKGEDVDIPKRQVTISEFEITKIEMPNVHFKVTCSKGTYIRSLAYDFGKALNSGAHLSALRRTKIGDYYVNDALNIDEFARLLPDNE